MLYLNKWGLYNKEYFDDVHKHYGQSVDIMSYGALKMHRRSKVPLLFMSGEPDSCKHVKCDIFIDCKKRKELQPPGTFNFYIPHSATSMWERRIHNVKHLTTNRPKITDKTEFCAFLYSHDVGFRTALFDQINTYKPVTALGKSRNPHFKQSDRRLYNTNLTFYDTAVEKYKPFKFVICCENSQIPGYVTEKIVNAFLSRSIPIYLGDPLVTEVFNPKSFIHVRDCQNLISTIKQLDENPELYKKMLNEPCFKNNTVPKEFTTKYTADRIKEYENKQLLKKKILRYKRKRR